MTNFRNIQILKLWFYDFQNPKTCPNDMFRLVRQVLPEAPRAAPEGGRPEGAPVVAPDGDDVCC
jgi:hypothetical protein